MKQLEYALANETEVLTFLKSRYPLYHMSNIFFRDIQYGIQTFFYRKKMSVGYADAEKIARAYVAQLEKKKTLSPIDQQSWVLNFPEFKKPLVAPAAPSKPAAKPAGPAPAVQSPAATTPAVTKPSLPPISRPAAAPASPKAGGLPPLSRPAASPATAKPGGLPPLKSASAPKAANQPAVPAEPQRLAAESGSSAHGEPSVPEASKAEEPMPTPPAKTIQTGEKKPLPPLQRATPAGTKKA